MLKLKRAYGPATRPDGQREAPRSGANIRGTEATVQSHRGERARPVPRALVLVLLLLERERVGEQWAWAWAAWLGASLDFRIGSLAWRVAPNLPRTLALRRWATLLPGANAILGIIVVAAVQLARGV